MEESSHNRGVGWALPSLSTRLMHFAERSRIGIPQQISRPIARYWHTRCSLCFSVSSLIRTYHKICNFSWLPNRASRSSEILFPPFVLLLYFLQLIRQVLWKVRCQGSGRCF